MEAEFYTFGPHKISRKNVFLHTLLSFASVNLRPTRPDVLVIPKREVKRFADLTAEEVADLWLTAQRVGRQLESFYTATSLSLTIQDGPQAGQSVPHVHIHILPCNHEAYLKEKELNKHRSLDKERKDRSPEEMAEEAEQYRKLFS